VAIGAQVQRAADGPEHLRPSTTRGRNLCATFLHRPTIVKGHAALSSQSGGIGHGDHRVSRARRRWAYRRSWGLGNKERHSTRTTSSHSSSRTRTTHIIAQHCEDLKDGRLVRRGGESACRRRSPIVVLKGRPHQHGVRAPASSHTGALAGNDKIYEDVFQAGGA